MIFARRKFLYATAGAFALPALPRIATAQTYPTRPITMIVPFPGGAPLDLIGRLLGERMRNSLGQPVTIENVSGADGNIGTARAARARPDGYTIELGGLGTHVVNGAFDSPQHETWNDFVPIIPLVKIGFILFARKTMPANNLNELLSWMKANPNKASAAFTNNGIRLVATFFQKETGTQFTLVPYRGLPAAVQDLAAGQIDLLFGTTDQLPLMRAGSIKAYAVIADARLNVAPDISTLAELGLPTLSFFSWAGLFAPRATPRDIVNRLNAAAAEALAEPAVRSRLADLGFTVFTREQQNPEVLGAMMKTDAEKWWRIVRESGIKAE